MEEENMNNESETMLTCFTDINKWIFVFKEKVGDLIQHCHRCPISLDHQFMKYMTQNCNDIGKQIKKRAAEIESPPTHKDTSLDISSHGNVVVPTAAPGSPSTDLRTCTNSNSQMGSDFMPVLDNTSEKCPKNVSNNSEITIAELDLISENQEEDFNIGEESDATSCLSNSKFKKKSENMCLTSSNPLQSSDEISVHNTCIVSNKEENTQDQTCNINNKSASNLLCTKPKAICHKGTDLSRDQYKANNPKKVCLDQKLCCEVCSAQFSSKAALASHMKWNHLAVNQHCEICGHKFRSRQAELRHYHKHHPNTEHSHKCNRCGQMFLNKTAHLYHQQTEDGRSACGAEANRRSHLKCAECDIVFSCNSQLRSHLEKKHAKIVAELQCDICCKYFSSNRCLREHKKAVHGSRSYTCPKCSAVFKWRSSLQVHKFRCDGTPKQNLNVFPEPSVKGLEDFEKTQLPAENCLNWSKVTDIDRSTANKKNANSSLMKSIVGSPKKLYACTLCNFKTFRYDIYKLHVYRHTDKSFACSICGNKYTNMYYLKRHERVAHEIGGFLCDICGRHFFTKAGYDRHLNNHNNVYPFRCEVCGKGFHGRKVKNIHFLARHRMKYACDYCECRFMKKSEVKKHIKTIHRDLLKKNSVSCNYCGKTFLEVQCLRDHIKSMHGPNPSPFACECGKTFRWRSSLASHRSRICKLRGKSEAQNVSTVISESLDHSCACGKAYHKKAALGSHRVRCAKYQAQQGITLPKPKSKETYQCPCGMRSKWRSAFRVHCKRCPDYLAKMSDTSQSAETSEITSQNTLMDIPPPSSTTMAICTTSTPTSETPPIVSNNNLSMPVASVVSQFPRMPVSGPVTVWLPNGAVASVFSAKPDHGVTFPPPAAFYPYLLPCSSALAAAESQALLPSTGYHGYACALESHQQQNRSVEQEIMIDHVNNVNNKNESNKCQTDS